MYFSSFLSSSLFVTANINQENYNDVCDGSFLNVLCYVGDAVDCDLVEIGLLGFLSAVFLGACSALSLLISLMDIRLDAVRENVEFVRHRRNSRNRRRMLVDEDGEIRVEMSRDVDEFDLSGVSVEEEEYYGEEEEEEEDDYGEETSLLP